jgi:hypothetical protein
MDSNPAFSLPAADEEGVSCRRSTAYVFPCICVDLQENFSGSQIQIGNPWALLPG